MSVVFLLIPLSIVFAVAFLFAFIWSVRSGQYEDTTTPSMRVLLDEQRESRLQRREQAPIPLTLTLSPREREQQTDALSSSNTSPAVTAATPVAEWQPERTAFPPLPKGEGRGEGKESAQSFRDFNHQP